MVIIIFIFGLLVIALSLWGIASPERMMKVVTDFIDRPWGIYFAIAVRLALGLVFILAADQTRTPELVKILGYLMLIAAVLIAVMGRIRMKAIIERWMGGSLLMSRGWLVLGVLFGAFLVYTAS